MDLQYLIQKIKHDYLTVSLDETIGKVVTNVELVFQMWLRRIIIFLKSNHPLQWNYFMEQYPLPNNGFREII